MGPSSALAFGIGGPWWRYTDKIRQSNHMGGQPPGQDMYIGCVVVGGSAWDWPGLRTSWSCAMPFHRVVPQNPFVMGPTLKGAHYTRRLWCHDTSSVLRPRCSHKRLPTAFRLRRAYA